MNIQMYCKTHDNCERAIHKSCSKNHLKISLSESISSKLRKKYFYNNSGPEGTPLFKNTHTRTTDYFQFLSHFFNTCSHELQRKSNTGNYLKFFWYSGFMLQLYYKVKTLFHSTWKTLVLTN